MVRVGLDGCSRVAHNWTVCQLKSLKYQQHTCDQQHTIAGKQRHTYGRLWESGVMHSMSEEGLTDLQVTDKLLPLRDLVGEV